MYIYQAENTGTCIHIQKKKKRATSKFKTTQPHIQNFPRHTHTQREEKKTVSETKNHFNTSAHTHTENYKHIKYQRGVKQTKVNTL